MKYLVLGAGGMAGHLIVHYLIQQGEEVEGLARRNLDFCKTHIIDATDFDKLGSLVKRNDYDIIINCIGVLNNNADDYFDNAILLNSYLSHFLVKETKFTRKRIFHISTDCVFSGRRGGYTESDIPDGDSNYAKTKALGELNDSKNLTFRCSIVGPDINENGIGLFHWFMKQNGEIDGYDKSMWTGITTLTLAKALHKASYTNLTGIYNLVNNKTISKFEIVSLFNKYTNKRLKINKIDGIVHNKSLICTRNDFDFIVPDYEDQINQMISWIKANRNLYLIYDLE